VGVCRRGTSVPILPLAKKRLSTCPTPKQKNPRTIRRALLAIWTPNGFLRRNLGGIIVLGIVVALPERRPRPPTVTP